MRFWELQYSALESLLREDDRSKVEIGQIDSLNKQIETLKKQNQTDFIPLVIGQNQPVNASYFVKSKGTPKADTIVYDNNSAPVAYISLKGSSHYWGRWIRLMKSYENPNNLSFNPGFKTFIARVKSITKGTLQPEESFYFDIVDEKVQQKIIYGSDFGGNFGINNVNVVLKGDAKIVPHGKVYALTANEVYQNGEIPEPLKAPRAVIHYGKGRRGGINNANIDTEPAGSKRRALPLNTFQDAKNALEIIRKRRQQSGIENVPP